MLLKSKKIYYNKMKGDIMRRKNNVQKKYVIVIIIISVVIILAILSYVLKNKKELNKFESLFKDSIIAVEKVVLTPFSFIANKVNDYKNLTNVLEENDTLEVDINRVNTLKAENEELRRQIDSMKKELSIASVLTDYEYLNATVINRKG